jgi:hypothetical protein
MQIPLGSYPCFGGPLDGGLVQTTWSRVWVHINRAQLDALIMRDALADDDPEPAANSVLAPATALFAPDDHFADAVVDVQSSSGHTLAESLADIDGVYVYDEDRLCLNWVQLKLSIPPREGTTAWKYRRLASLLVRDWALRTRLQQYHAEPDHRAHLDVILQFTNDLGLVARARAYYAYKMARRWDPPNLPGM